MTFLPVSDPPRPLARSFFIPTIGSIFVMMILVLIAPIMSADGPPDGSGNNLRQIGYGLLFLATVGLVGGYRNPRKLLVPPLLVMLAIGWCWLSLFWSVAPSISLRRLILTTLVLWTIYMAVEECGFDRTVKCMMVCMVVLLAANYVAVLGWPQAGIHQASVTIDEGIIGDWKGVLPQKNFTGAACALTILLFAFFDQNVGRVLRAGVVLAAGFFLYMTESKTSMGMLVLSLAAGGVYYLFTPRLRVVLIPAIAIAGIAAMMYTIRAWDQMEGPFERRDALTGRAEIWPYLIAYAEDHPITGAGFGAFWNIGKDSPIYVYSKNWVAALSNGHNGYLDLLVQVGWPGLILAVLALMIVPMQQLLSNAFVSRARGALLIGLIVFCIGHNMTETGLLERDIIVGVFLIFAAALAQAVCRRAGPARSGEAGQRGRSRARTSSSTSPDGSGVVADA